MQEVDIDVLESQLDVLLAAVRSAGSFEDVAHYLADLIEKLHYHQITEEDEMIEALIGAVRISKPSLLTRAWEDSWSNLFSHVIQLILSSRKSSELVIGNLLGGISLPPEVDRETILCINPGSTSTKVALFKGLEEVAADEVHLPPDYPDSIENRADGIVRWLEKKGLSKGELTGIACRGGFLKPVPSGTYEVCKEMLDDLKEARIDHASNMAIPIGLKVKERFAGTTASTAACDDDSGEGVLVTTTDPVSTDEMIACARLTGIRKLLRDGSGAHYLNHKAVHRFVSSILDKRSDELVTITAHIGGGISIARHEGNVVRDVINAFSGIPSANRSGNIPLDIALRKIDEGELSVPELKKYLYREGGLIDLTGTNDFRALLHFRDSGSSREQREKIELVIEFYSKNIAGAVMSLSAIEEYIDVITLTGGIAKSSEFTSFVKRKLYPYFPAVVVPGSLEHESMVAGQLMAKFVPHYIKNYVEERDKLREQREREERIIETEIFPNPHFRKKENTPVTSLDELIYLARGLVAKHRVPTVAIVGAENEDAVVAAKQANEEGRYPIARFVLIGDFYEINKLAWEFDIKVDGKNYSIIDSKTPVDTALDLYEAGKIDLLMKGGVKTEQIMRGTLKRLKEMGRLKKGKIYSHVGVFQIPTYPKLLLVTDAAVNPRPDREQKKKILENALMVTKILNISKPKVAVISAVETTNPSVESSVEANEFAAMYADTDDCIVEGPLSLDVAIDPHSAAEKKYQGKIRGNADILLMPDIEAGNVVYKALTVSSGAYLAGAVVGAGIPIILTSRGDSARSKLASISLACVIALRQGTIS